MRRIGAIHAVSSGDAANGQAAVVLGRSGAGKWSFDNDAMALADTLTQYTIPALRRKLR